MHKENYEGNFPGLHGAASSSSPGNLNPQSSPEGSWGELTLEGGPLMLKLLRKYAS